MKAYEKLQLLKAAAVLFVFLSGASVFAQSAEAPPEEPAGNIGFGLQAELTGGISLIIPDAGILIGFPVQIDSISITPKAGFCYMFDIWSDLHQNLYVPFALSFVHEAGIGIELGYRLPATDLSYGHFFYMDMISVPVFLSADGFMLGGVVKIGPSVILESGGKLRFMFNLQAGILTRYLF